MLVLDFQFLCGDLRVSAVDEFDHYFVSDNTTVDKLGARDVAIASSVSKIFASTLTYPHEVYAECLTQFC